MIFGQYYSYFGVIITLLLEEIFQKSERELKDVFCAQVTEVNMIDWFIILVHNQHVEDKRRQHCTVSF